MSEENLPQRTFSACLPVIQDTRLDFLLDAIPSELFPAGGATLSELLRVAGLKREGLPPPREGIHGITHYRMVAALAVKLALFEGWDAASERALADLWCLWVAGALHDLKRWDDALDWGHAARGSKLAESWLPTQGVGADLTATVSRLILHHGADDETALAPLDLLFKDADGLDRFRLGLWQCDRNRLRTVSAKALWPEMKDLYQRRR